MTDALNLSTKSAGVGRNSCGGMNSGSLKSSFFGPGGSSSRRLGTEDLNSVMAPAGLGGFGSISSGSGGKGRARGLTPYQGISWVSNGMNSDAAPSLVVLPPVIWDIG